MVGLFPCHIVQCLNNFLGAHFLVCAILPCKDMKFIFLCCNKGRVFPFFKNNEGAVKVCRLVETVIVVFIPVLVEASNQLSRHWS